MVGLDEKKLEGVTTWTTFQCIFQEQYIPKDYVHHMKLGFIELTQGHLTIIEYKVKFDKHKSYFLSLNCWIILFYLINFFCDASKSPIFFTNPKRSWTLTMIYISFGLNVFYILLFANWKMLNTSFFFQATWRKKLTHNLPFLSNTHLIIFPNFESKNLWTCTT